MLLKRITKYFKDGFTHRELNKKLFLFDMFLFLFAVYVFRIFYQFYAVTSKRFYRLTFD